MSVESFQVVLVPFPFADRLVEKLRPAVVVSAPSLLADAGVLWLAMMTSSERRRLPGDVEVSDVERAGVLTACRVRTTKLATLDPRRIVEVLGVLPTQDARQVMECVAQRLALAQ